MADEQSFDDLTHFVDRFGPRLSASDNLERSIDWIMEELKSGPPGEYSHPRSYGSTLVRGEKYATLLAPRERNLPMLGLDGSIATPEQGI